MNEEQIKDIKNQENEIGIYVRDTFNDVLNLQVTNEARISELGFKSIEIMKIYDRLKEKFPEFSVSDIFESIDISDLIHCIYINERN